jgi:hypothetical protein
MFTGVVRQRCQSGLLLLSNQRASARLGSLRLYSARHRETPLEGGGAMHSANTSQYNLYMITDCMRIYVNAIILSFLNNLLIYFVACMTTKWWLHTFIFSLPFDGNNYLK